MQRAILLGVVSLGVALLYDLWLLPVWFFAYMAALALHLTVLRRLPDNCDGKMLALPVVTMVVAGMVYLVAGLYMWVLPIPEFKIYSILMTVVAALSTISRRTGVMGLLIADLVMIGLGIALRAGWLWWSDPFSQATIGMTFTLFVAFYYFFRTALKVAQDQRTLRVSRTYDLANARREALSQFTGGVAHDFNNLLTAVLGNMELARLAPGDDERDELMSEAEKAARRGAELTTQLLALSAKARLRPVQVTPEVVLRELSATAREELSDKHRLVVEVGGRSGVITVDQPKLQMALMELVHNAASAMPDGGEIRVSVAGGGTDPGGIVFTVSDTGPGIPASIHPFVFEPYFTTKQVGQGSGLGLAMVRGFAEQSGGSVELAPSAEGQGAAFRLSLPGGVPTHPDAGSAADIAGRRQSTSSS